jgi:hypothetical protein
MKRLALLLLLCASCGRDSSLSTPPSERDLPALSEPLLLALAQAKNYHHQADVHLADGDTDAAMASVSAILTIQFPPDAPEGQDTLLDARARLAKLCLGSGKLDDARRVIDEGLAMNGRESFFLANLYTVSGEVHEAQGRKLDPTDAAAARAERKAALSAYDRALQIEQRLQKQLYKEARP